MVESEHCHSCLGGQKERAIRRHANVEMMSLGRNSVVDLPASNLVALCALLSVRMLCQGQPAEIK